MTREKAIEKLKNFADHCYPNEEFLMAIKALEQEPCEDAISRQATLDSIDEFIRQQREYTEKTLAEIITNYDFLEGVWLITVGIVTNTQ